MFEKATKFKFRFNTSKGLLTTEDLWDLPLTNSNGLSLDNVAKDLNREIKESEVESFVEIKGNKNLILESKFEIVKHIIKVRLDNAEKSRQLVEKRRKNERLRQLIANKKDEELSGKSVEELEKMLED